jgi:hypothetical protein
MESIQRRLLALFVSIMVSMTSVPASADENLDDQVNNRPSAAAMVTDAFIARPLLGVLTAGGTVVFLASLPFSALGGNVTEAGKMLVVGPAKQTFLRCLGCTAIQDEWKDKQVVENASASN